MLRPANERNVNPAQLFGFLPKPTIQPPVPPPMMSLQMNNNATSMNNPTLNSLNMMIPDNLQKKS
jgi:hypothetical protein